MKLIILFLLPLTLLLATPLKNIEDSFSKSVKEKLLKEMSDSSSLHSSNSYSFKKGWNKAVTPEDGIKLKETFKDISKVKYVITYDNLSKYWAIYSPEAKYPKGESLFLKYLEPYTTFFVLAKDDVDVKTTGKTINKECKKIMQDKEYDFFVDSGKSKSPTMNKDKTMSLTSRYYSHNERGLYDDSRVLLIYPKLVSKTKRSYNYGPGIPKIHLQFTKEYENKKFYIYDFKREKCYKGIFPSPRVPPFPLLVEVK